MAKKPKKIKKRGRRLAISRLILVVASSYEVVDGNAEENAQFDKSVVVGLISADFPARNRGV